ncbi:MAG: putative bifunctional diguanylate cyclase/phosphodiesterase [Candidatus Baltobacteraceae bacterium]
MIDHQTVTHLAEELGCWGTFLADYRLNTITATSGFRRISGLDDSAGSLAVDDFFARIHPDDRADFNANRNRAIHQRIPLAMKLRLLLENGDVRHVQMLMRFVYDLQGNATHGSGIIMDVSDTTEAAAQGLVVADSDWLTGLASRTAFFKNLEKSVEAARERHKRVGLLLINIDHFGKVNETIGHAQSDAILREIARRLALFAGVQLARIAGDEFACILTRIDDELEMHELVHKMHVAVVNPPPVGPTGIRVTCGAGLAVFPDDGEDGLFQRAEIALSRAKHAGRGTLCRYEPEFERIISRERQLAGDLRKAMQEKQFEVFYQPVVDAHTLRVVGLEALLRWRHPSLGLLAPSAFLDNLEKDRTMLEVGDWMLPAVCDDVIAFQKAFGAPIQITMNLSAQQLMSPTLVKNVSSALKKSGADPALLGFEVTEQTIIRDVPQVVKTLKRLRALGTSICIDDFGTGHNTLTHLKSLPVDCVKIDRSFIHDLTSNRFSRAICTSITDLGHALGLRIVAEGVETEAQALRLREMACDQFQGFLYGRPLPKDKIFAQPKTRDARDSAAKEPVPPDAVPSSRAQKK